MKKARNKIDPERVLYDLDASWQTALLKRPGNPKTHVPEMLRDLAEHGSSNPGRSDARAMARELLMDHLASPTKADFVFEYGRAFENGMLFQSMSAFAGNKDKALSVSISKAFAMARLDPAEPLDWYVLLSRMCWAHFGEPGKPGAKRKWSDEQYCKLLKDVHRAKLTIRSDQDNAAFKWLKKERVYNLSTETLKTALREARDYEFNRALVVPMYEALNADFPKLTAMYSSAEMHAQKKVYARVEADKIGASIENGGSEES